MVYRGLILKHEFRVINGCPCPKNLAPYIFIVCHEAKVPALSIYRGADARSILNSHGKHDQSQLYWLSINGTPAQREAVGLPPGGGGVNEPGHSTHEQFSDGVAYPSVTNGHVLAWWQIGFDVDPNFSPTCIKVAKRHGWELFRPYTSGIEFHHLNFRHEPIPHTLKMRIQIKWIRRKLPHH